MEFSELVRARRSIRRYQEKPVPKELLRELLETACWVNAATILGYGPVIRDAFAPEKGEFLSLVTLGYSDAYPLAPKRKSGRFDIR